MQHYYKKIMNNQKKIILREQAIEECLKRDDIKKEELEQLKQSFQNYSYGWYGIRLVPVFAIGLLTQTGVLQKRSRFFLKEIGLMGGFIFLIIGLDFQNSQYLWDLNGQIVKQYVNYSDNLIMDEKRLEQMRKMYSKQNEKIKTNQKQDSDSDSKMYQEDEK